jgi:hypothetical protein
VVRQQLDILSMMLRSLADKAKMPRHVLNRVGEHLVRTVRLGGKASAEIDRAKGVAHADALIIMTRVYQPQRNLASQAPPTVSAGTLNGKDIAVF